MLLVQPCRPYLLVTFRPVHCVSLYSPAGRIIWLPSVQFTLSPCTALQAVSSGYLPSGSLCLLVQPCRPYRLLYLPSCSLCLLVQPCRPYRLVYLPSGSLCLLVQPCRPYRLVYLASSPLLTLAPFALVNSGPCHAAIDYVSAASRLPIEHTRADGWASFPFQFYNLCIKRGESIFRTCQGSHLGSGFWGWSFQYSGTMYFLPSGIRRIGSGNVHCVLCILGGLKN